MKVALPLVGAKQPVMSTSSSCSGSGVMREEEEEMRKAVTRISSKKNFIVTPISDDRHVLKHLLYKKVA